MALIPGPGLLLVLLATSTVGLLTGQCRFPDSAASQLLTYAFQQDQNGSGMVHVRLTFQGSPQGADELDLPLASAGQVRPAVLNLHVLSSDATLDGATIRHKPSALIELAYDLQKDWDGPFQFPMQFHAVVLPHFLVLRARTGLVEPNLPGDTPVTVRFDWTGMPSDWAIATSFGAGLDRASRCQQHSGKLRDLDDALFTAGDFRLHPFPVGNRMVMLAIRGKWTFSDDDAAVAIGQAIRSVREFFGDENFPYFVVTLNQTDVDLGSSDGTGFQNGFSLYFPPSAVLKAPTTLIVHEAFHAWNPGRMGGWSADNDRLTWFYEGFTDYYGGILALRDHLISLPDYVQELNTVLRSYETAPTPYNRGRRMALWLNHQIREDSGHTKSLDDVMKDMVRESGKAMTLARVIETTGRYLSAESRAQWQKVISDNTVPPLPGDAGGPCSHLTEQHLFNAGFDVSGSRPDRIIKGVRTDGPAYVAGLRDGQYLVRVSLPTDQPDQMAVLEVDDGNGVRRIEYYPRDPVRTLRQYQIDDAAYTARPESCVLPR
jgi:predicted metalloprotease with PDZ domain